MYINQKTTYQSKMLRQSIPNVKQLIENQMRKENVECCCDIGDAEAATDESTITPTIEDFVNIIEESNILLDRRLSLQLILMVDAFIGLTIIKGSDDNCSTQA